ncbi:helix-turn-helix domain-containing protein [Gimesia fumaroli]|uniref:Helix-turn-helix domain-containing protein n=1 Tax=Gimesia fumaroli TaxID=2527976 RepID=A0A518I956_9PLAN|nr:helix-turn-helix domain-containing protein [Gimesia fumaroli]QDV49589.1 hypothetical protein Enr17x_16090 [Gimesia fumaroli]
MQQKSLPFVETKRRQLVGLPLSTDAKVLMVVLDEIAGSDDFCCPSLPDLSRLMGCSEHKARKAIREAESAGFLEVEKLPGKATAYRIEWPAITNTECEEFNNVNRYL